MMTAKMLRDETGSIGMMAGLLMVVLVPSVMAAVDLSNVTATKEKVQGRLDGAVIASAQFKDLEEAHASGEMQKRGETFILNAIEGSGIEIKNPVTTFVYDEDENTINAVIEFDAPTVFVGDVFDMDRITVTSQITPPELVELEVALSLDVSGSMGWQITSDSPAPVGSRRIDAMRQGINSMLEVFDENPLIDARVSVIPYSSSVNISATSEGTGTDTWAVENAEQSGTGKMTLIGLIRRWINRIKKNKTAGTPATSVLPLSEGEDAMTHISMIEPRGGTAGHIGAEWALYSLLPDWQDVWNHPEKPPADAGDDARKIMVMMTDGDFTVTQTPGLTVEDAYEIFQDTCQKARDLGITVYTVGLKASKKTDDELTKCAGSADKYFPVASRGAIKKAFEKIGEDATKLHISK